RGDDKASVRRAPHPWDQRGGRKGRELLEIVEHHEHAAASRERAGNAIRRVPRRGRYAQRPADRVEQRSLVPRLAEIAEPRASREMRPDRGGEVKREARLACPPRP